MSELTLRWVERGASAPGPTPGTLLKEVVDSLTVIVGTSRLADERWLELTDAQRRELIAMLRGRVDRLVGQLAGLGLLRG